MLKNIENKYKYHNLRSEILRSGFEKDDDFAKKINGLVNVLERLPYVEGFCYTQFSDVQQEKNGLVDEDRNLRLPIEVIRKIIRQESD